MATTTPQPETITEPHPDTLTGCLARVQGALPHIQKAKTAQVQMKGGGSYSYKYADLALIQPLVLNLLAAEGLTWVTRPTTMEGLGMVLAYELTHPSGEQLTGFYPLPDPRQRTAQEVGSAITYARRYTLCCVVGIVPDEDEDGVLAVSAQKEADARRAEEQQEQRRLDAERGPLLDRIRAVSPDPPKVAAEWTAENGDHIARTTNLDGLRALAERMERGHNTPQNADPMAAAQNAAAAVLGAAPLGPNADADGDPR